MTCRVRFGAALVPPTVVARARLHDARARSQPIGFAALSAPGRKTRLHYTVRPWGVHPYKFTT
eukprot:1231722-Prymnesium_polylepis.1